MSLTTKSRELDRIALGGVHQSSTGDTSGCVSLGKKLHSHCSSLPSCNWYYQAVMTLAGEKKAGPTSLVDVAIQGKINDTHYK